MNYGQEIFCNVASIILLFWVKKKKFLTDAKTYAIIQNNDRKGDSGEDRTLLTEE
jgi:hypothetical protein